MSDVFLLGAGFSKAVSYRMPVTKELSQEILETYEFQEPISPEIRSMLQEDFEKALRQNAAFVPAALDRRAETMRVVFSIQRVDVHDRNY